MSGTVFYFSLFLILFLKPFAAFSNACCLAIAYTSFSAIDVPHLLSICHATLQTSKLSFPITCTRTKTRTLSQILTISELHVSIFFKTSSLFACSVRNFLSILRQNDTTVTSSRLFVCEVILQYSLLYSRIYIEKNLFCF